MFSVAVSLVFSVKFVHL